MKRNLLLAVASMLCLYATVSAQNVFNPNDPIINFNGTPQPTPPANTFVKWGRTPSNALPFPFNTDNFKAYYYNGMAFRLRYPNNYNPASGTKYPVILFFHGIGEAGPTYDNENNLSWGAQQFESRVNNGQFNAFLLFPQTTVGDWAYNYDNINAVLDALQQYCNTDADRVITMGLSLGGDGTMKYTFQYPQRSAISIPASPGSIGEFTQDPTPFIHVPFWIASGGLDDQFANPQRVQAFVNNFTNHGGDIRWTYYPERGHGTWPYMWDEPYLLPYWQTAHKANPLVFNKQTDFPANTPFNVKLGITGGFAEYQWQKDNADIGGAGGNEITVNQPGTYRARFRRVAGGNWSDWSLKPAVITQPAGSDNVAPSAPGNLRVVSGNTNSVTLDWDNSTDNVAVTGYDVYVNGTKRYSTSNSDIVADNLSPATTYTFTVQAHDAANNFSAFSNAVSGTTTTPPDVTAPSIPGNLRVAGVSTNTVSLDWDNSTDNVSVAGYDVFVNGTKRYSTTSSDIVADNLNPSTGYNFMVQARDAANNLSGFSNNVFANTSSVPDVTPPSTPANLHVVSASTNSITLDWDNSSDDRGLAGYDVFVNGVKQYSTTTSDIVAGNLSPATTYSFTVQARDIANNFSGFSSAVNGTTNSVAPPVDVTPPSTPGNLRVLGVTTNTVSLDWDNSADNNGVTGYDIFVDGVKRYSSVGSELEANSLEAGRTYTFTVQAHDAANNFSGFSNAVQATTTTVTPPLDVTPPTAPTNLRVTSTSSNSIGLDWDPSSDDNGVTGYDVFVNGVKKYATQNTDLLADNLTPGTAYTFTVQAHDSRNFSAFSNTATATTTSTSTGSINYKFYQGSFNSLPDFNSLIPAKTGVSGNVDISVRPAGVDDNFAFLWEGNINITTPGSYTFETVSDDGSKLYFNTTYSAGANALVNNDGLHAANSVKGTVNIVSPGSYPIAISFFEQGGGEAMQVYWSGPGFSRQLIPGSVFSNNGTPPVETGSGLNYKYFEGAFSLLPDFNALTPIKSGNSANVDLGVRNAGVNDNFAIVWQGFIKISTPGNYTFETVSDDGSKLYFNTAYSAGAMALVNNDGLHAPSSATGSVNVPVAGAYPITISFFEATGGETMEVYWTGPGFGRERIPNSAFSTTGTPPESSGGLNYKYYEGSFTVLPNFNALAPVKTGSTSNIDLGLRNPGINDNFAFVWEGSITIPASGTYTFETVSDDGSRLYFNSLYNPDIGPLVNNDGLHAATSATGTVTIAAGTYPIAITYFEATGGESMQVYWSGPGFGRQLIPNSAFSGNVNPPAGSTGLNYKYYEGAFSTLPEFNGLTPVKTGTTTNVDLSVRTPGVNDNFSVLWEGFIHITTPGNYTFETISDDGSKLYFNSMYSPGAVPLVDNNGLHAAISATGTTNIPAPGYYPIAISYFEATGGENMQVYWTGPGIPRQLIPSSAFTTSSGLSGGLSMSQNTGATSLIADAATTAPVMQQLYPNPFSDNLMIRLYTATPSGKLSVDITDISGRTIYKQNFGNLGAGNHTLRINPGKQAVNAGVYFVRLMVNGLPVKVTKVVKK